MTIGEWISYVDGLVWGTVMMVLIIVVGVLLSVRTKFHPQRRIGLSLKYAVTNEEGAEGDVSSFGALTTALAATVGTGNIVGVSTAIMGGGPGALFWMEFAAFFGIATKYAEGVLAVKYRHVKEDGSILGGPFYYIEKGMGSGWKWLGKLFALFGALAGALGIGTSTQVNGIVNAINKVAVEASKDGKLKVAFTLFKEDQSWVKVIAAIIITAGTIAVIVGGIQRIAQVTEKIVPAMMVLYVVSALLVFFLNIGELPRAIVDVFAGAFGFRPVAAGTAGAAFALAMQKGVARGIFSNEAGLGSAPIAAAAAQTRECVRQGMVSSTGTFLDTIVICTLTGLCVVMTGANTFVDEATGELLAGVEVTMHAFAYGVPWPPMVGYVILATCLALFAFSTILGWDYYAERCFDYLTNGNKAGLMAYRWLYVAAVAIGPFLPLGVVWDFADLMNGLMAFPNLVALFVLSGVVAKETKEFWDRKTSGAYDDGLAAAKAAKAAKKAAK